jgi:hypothetical protein
VLGIFEGEPGEVFFGRHVQKFLLQSIAHQAAILQATL